MPQLGVQVVGSNLGLRATLDQSVAAANTWADAMIGAGERAGAGIAAALGAVDDEQAGLRASYAGSTNAARVWGSETLAASVRAARGIELTGVAALQAEVAYARLGMAVSRYSAGTVGEAQAVARYTATVQALYEKQVLAANAAVAAQERAALKFEGSIRSVGRSMTTHLGLPLAAVAYESLKLATNFQSSMTRIQTYAGASGAEVQKMGAEILNSASVLPQGPVKASEGLYHLESIGIRGPQALDALKASAVAAGAGMADLTDSVTALGGALVSGVKGGEDAKTAMAGLVTIAGQGNMTMQDMADAMGTGLLVKAHNVGISLREVGAAMDVLVDRGLPARRAATYLGTTLALMSAPSAEARNALADMGVDANKMGKMLLEPDGLLNVLNMLSAGMKSVGKARGAADIMSAFGRSRQSTGILTLVESLDAKTSSYSQKLAAYDQGVAEAAQRMALYQTTAQYKMHSALSQVEADFIKLGSGAMPYVADGLKMLSESINAVVDAFDKLPGPEKEAFGALAGVVAVGGPILIGIAFVMKGLRQLGILLGGLGGPAKIGAAGADSAIATIGVAADEASLQVAELQAQVDALKVSGMITPGGVILPGAGAGAVAAAETGAVESSAFSMAAVGAVARTAVSRLLPGMLFAMGGQMAGSIVENAVPGTIGHDIGSTVKLAGLGAGIGTMIEPGLGTAAGAAIGVVIGGLTSLIHSAPSFQESMLGLDRSLQQLGETAHNTAVSVTGLHLNRLQIQDSMYRQMGAVQTDRKTVQSTIAGTKAHAQAVRQLEEDQLQLKLTEQQVLNVEQQIATARQQHTQALNAASLVRKTQADKLFGLLPPAGSLTKYNYTVNGGRAGSHTFPMYSLPDSQPGAATQSLHNYAMEMYRLSNEVAQTDPVLAQMYAKLASIAELGKKPTYHDIVITIKTKGAFMPMSQQGLKLMESLQGHLLTGMFNDAVTGALGQPPKNNDKTQKTSPGVPPPLTQAQQVQLAFAQNRYDRNTINEEIAIDNAQISRLQRQREAGKINNLQYVNAVTSIYQDRQDMMSRLAQLDKKAAMNVKGYQVSLALQAQMARADALAAGQSGLSGPTPLQMKLAEQAKAAAMKAINSHKLTMQGLIDAWNVVSQANATIAQGFVGSSRTYARESTDAITDSIKGLTRAQELQLRERLAQRDAHRGYHPLGAAADGFLIGTAHDRHHKHHQHLAAQAIAEASWRGGAGGGSAGVYINKAEFTIKGIDDVHQLLAEIERLTKRRGGQRTGTRR